MSETKVAFDDGSAKLEPIFLRMALSGPPGCGKTFSALSIAEALDAGPVLVIDSERKSALRYRAPRGPFAFRHAPLDGDYHPRRYVDTIREAAQHVNKAAPGVLVVDSLSHAWNGPRGILELVDAAGGWFAKGGAAKEKLAKINALERELLSSLLDFPGHVIVTMRTKNAYEDVEGENGKQKKKKVGLAAVQREGVEYEFDVCLRIEGSFATVEKTRCSALNEKTFDRPGKNVAAILQPWLGRSRAENLRLEIEAALSELRSEEVAEKARAEVAKSAGDETRLGKILDRLAQRVLEQQAGGGEAPTAPKGGGAPQVPTGGQPDPNKASPPPASSSNALPEKGAPGAPAGSEGGALGPAASASSPSSTTAPPSPASDRPSHAVQIPRPSLAPDPKVDVGYGSPAEVDRAATREAELEQLAHEGGERLEAARRALDEMPLTLQDVISRVGGSAGPLPAQIVEDMDRNAPGTPSAKASVAANLLVLQHSAEKVRGWWTSVGGKHEVVFDRRTGNPETVWGEITTDQLRRFLRCAPVLPRLAPART